MSSPADLQVPAKRRRSASPTADPDAPISSTREAARPGKRNVRADGVDGVADWPPLFRLTNQTHEALNIVYTFLSARRNVVTTFDSLKSTVESQIRRTLTVEEVSRVVALRPESMFFGYVDGAALRAEARGQEQEDSFEQFGSGRSPDHGPRSVAAGGAVPQAACGEQVLYFKFVDADLKRQVRSKKNGEAARPTKRLRDEPLKMPVYGQKQMSRLIEKRNGKFAGCISAFVGDCVARGLDPGDALRRAARDHVPVPADTGNDAAEAATSPTTLPPEIPSCRKSISEIVEELKSAGWYTGQIVPDGHRAIEARDAVYGDLDFLLSQNAVNALYNAKGITRFYLHQAEALNALHAGHNVVVSTSTSSGKSLVYQLPVLNALERDAAARALYIFPTKALAQDQKRSLREMLGYLDGLEQTLVETFDGDTPMSDRSTIRDEARIIFTNPDMLHITIMPQEAKWRTFLKHLRFVVVDELHYYNGPLGAHVAYIMRRLRRICAAVGNRHVKFIACSATVANPVEHFKSVFGVEDVKLVESDGSPCGKREFLCWNTPFRDPGDPTSGRGSAKMECARLICQLILRGVRLIAFCRVRAQCESLLAAVREELRSLGRPECAGRVVGYRGGYTAQDRRLVESDMFEGKLLGIVATTALELGVDIGTLDCVISWGFPYTIANLRQQSGRAGRRCRDSLSILVGDGFPVDQHYMQNPGELFSKPHGSLQIDLDNLLVREGHVQCAAFEMPIRPDGEEDGRYFGAGLRDLCRDRLVPDRLGFFHCHDRYRPAPARLVAIRDTEDDDGFAVVDVTDGRNVVLEELEASRATFTLYDGAVFLHQGTKYLVRDFAPDKKLARVELARVDWTTVQRDFTDIDPVATEAVASMPGSPSRVYYGTIRICQKVFGFFRQDKNGRVLDAVSVENPPVIRHGKGMWLDVPRETLDVLRQRRLHVAAAIHAAEHAVMSLLPTVVVSMPGDVRTECKDALKEFSKRETQRKRPGRLIFYDSKGGSSGSGVTTKAFEFVHLLLRQALDRIGSCGCERGCLECVAHEACHKSNEVISKAGSRAILMGLLGMEIDPESLPMGPEEHIPEGVETVVLSRPLAPAAPPQVGG